MDFYIMGLVPEKIQFNTEKLGLYTLGELGNDTGLILNSGIRDFRSGKLAILCQIEFFVRHERADIWIAKTRHITMFDFENESLLRRGPTKRALAALGECMDLSQAHAYGHFCYVAERNELPLMPTRPQPFEQMEQSFLAFLNKYNTLIKKK